MEDKMEQKMEDKLFDWLFGVIERPVQTLNEIAQEKPIGWALLVALGVSALTVASNTLGGAGYHRMDEAMREFNFFVSPALIIAGSVLLAAVWLFIITGVLHLLSKLFGGKGGYWNLFSAYSFAGFPMIISVPVSFVGAYLGVIGNLISGLVTFGITIWVLVLQVIALRESHDLTTGASIGIYLINFALLFVIIFVLIIALLAAVLLPMRLMF